MLVSKIICIKTQWNVYYVVLLELLSVVRTQNSRQYDRTGINNPYDPYLYRYRDFYNYNQSPQFNSNQDSLAGPKLENFVDKRCPEAIHDRFPHYLTVRTYNGAVNGRYVYLCDGPSFPIHKRPNKNQNVYDSVSVFLGIPYARPPKDGLRFKPPEFHPSWGSIDAYKYKPACPQHYKYYGLSKGVKIIDEDCLYLNIFSPFAEVSLQDDKRFAVMIYIHGGFWDHGSANTFPAHMLAASQEVVVVSFNYRLGPLGFLATGDNASPGNYGILDQVMAIQWVYDNIGAFNGDPNRITLFGSGAGAASAGLLAVSPLTNYKVHRVIAQSGSAVADWAVIADNSLMRNNSLLLGKALDCDTRSSWKLISCLRSLSFSKISAAAVQPVVGWIPWGPVVDRQFQEENKQILPLPLELLLKSRQNVHFHSNFAYMTGVTQDEAVSMLWDDPELRSNKYVLTESFFNKKISQFASFYNYTLDPEALLKAISFMYKPWNDKKNTTLLWKNLIDMLSDSYYKAPMDKMVKLLLQNNVTTYMYVMNYTIEGLSELFQHQKLTPEASFNGMEYYLITGAPFMDPRIYPSELNLMNVNWTEGDRNMSHFLMKAWANFAKHGNPTSTILNGTTKWEPIGMAKLQYLLINTTNATTVMKLNYRQKESQFWNDYLPLLMGKVNIISGQTLSTYFQEEKKIYYGSLWGVIAATVLFLFLSLLFCLLYCNTKRKHLVDDDDIPEAVSTPVSTETVLSMRKGDINKYLSEDSSLGLNKNTQV